MTALPDRAALTAADFKSDYRPVWCPGCGHYSVLSSLTKALAELGVRREDVAVISGIGCSSRIPAYTSVYGFHSLHGRALPVAIGLKVTRPDLTVIVAGGDGDGYSIGGNHFLHACRRNVDLHLRGDGQPGLRHDQGPGVADDARRLEQEQADPARRLCNLTSGNLVGVGFESPSAGHASRMGYTAIRLFRLAGRKTGCRRTRIRSSTL